MSFTQGSQARLQASTACHACTDTEVRVRRMPKLNVLRWFAEMLPVHLHPCWRLAAACQCLLTMLHSPDA
eukprot:6201979-Pleurochrysis_carterae.AAC.4